LKKEILFKKIIQSNQDRIIRICNYYSANKSEIDDISQEIFANIWKSIDNFRGDSSIDTWVYRVAVNTALSYSGKSFKRMKLIINSDKEMLTDIIEQEDELQLYQEQFDRLQAELNSMSVINKALISLVLEGLNYKEIADIIGITESNVRVKIHRIKSSLRTKLKEEQYD
jgi:RNA polymerase sigma-70 factor (ECF subfamily)